MILYRDGADDTATGAAGKKKSSHYFIVSPCRAHIRSASGGLSFQAARYRACASRTAGDVTIAALSAVIDRRYSNRWSVIYRGNEPNADFSPNLGEQCRKQVPLPLGEGGR